MPGNELGGQVIINCKEASQLVSQAMDRPLGWRKRFDLWVHLVVCGMCRQFLKQLRLVRVTLRRMVSQAESDESVKLTDEARSRIRKALDK